MKINAEKEFFYNWLVGMVDGDGCFSIISQKTKWNLIFKVGLSDYNQRVLYFIKKQLKAGTIYVESNRNMAHFRIRDIKTLEKVIFPIFDNYPLLTSKAFNYDRFKKAYFIIKDSKINKEDRDFLLNSLREEKIPENYIAPVWNDYQNCDIKKIMKKAWLIGFSEAEASFYLVSKDENRIVHGFGITQKLDLICLEAIRKILHIKTKVVLKKHNYYQLDTTNSRAIENIINYFQDTMKGMKAVEYKIWARSYRKDKGNYLRLKKIRDYYRIMKKLKPNKNLFLG